MASEGCQQKIITSPKSLGCINTKLLHQTQTPSLGLLKAELFLLQASPWVSMHGWGVGRAGLQRMVLNKTRRDRRLCVLFCVFPYRVWWFGICQVNRLRTDGKRCETPLISEGLFQKHRAQAHAGPFSHVLFAKTAPNVLHAGGELLCPCTSGSSNLLPLSALPLPAPTILCLIQAVLGNCLWRRAALCPVLAA